MATPPNPDHDVEWYFAITRDGLTWQHLVSVEYIGDGKAVVVTDSPHVPDDGWRDLIDRPESLFPHTPTEVDLGRLRTNRGKREMEKK